MRTDAQERLELENDLRRALQNKELVLCFQPKVQLNSGKVAGFEALLRWRHPKHGVISPSATERREVVCTGTPAVSADAFVSVDTWHAAEMASEFVPTTTPTSACPGSFRWPR